jgi:hypothetical protein
VEKPHGRPEIRELWVVAADDLGAYLTALCTWAEANISAVQAAQQRYDQSAAARTQ